MPRLLNRYSFSATILLAIFLADCAWADATASDALQEQIESQAEAIRQLQVAQEEHSAKLRRLPVDPETESASTEASADAADAAIVERLDRLERSVLGIESEQVDFVEALSATSARTMNGRIHLDHWTFPSTSPGVNILESGTPIGDPEDRILIRRARVGIRGTVPPGNVSYRLEFEFSGETGGRVRDAWLGWDQLPVLNTVRLGNQKRPYGLDHLNSSNFNVFLERPTIIDAVNEDNRRLGLMSYGVTRCRSVNWRCGIFNAVPIQRTHAIIGDNYQMETAGRIASTLWYNPSRGNYGHLGLSGSAVFPDGNSPNDGVRNNQARFRTFPEGRSGKRWFGTGRIDEAESYQLLGVENVVNFGSLQFGAEYHHAWLQREDSLTREVRFHGGYAYFSWFLTGEHLPWDRELGILRRVQPRRDFVRHKLHCACPSGPGAWQLAMRYSYIDLNDEDILGGRGESATVALNWYWNSHSRVQFNYIFGRIEDRRGSLSNGRDVIVSGDYQIAGTRFMIDF